MAIHTLIIDHCALPWNLHVLESLADSSEPQESFPDDTTIKSYHQPSYPPHKTSVQSLEDELAQTSPDLKREEPLSPQNGDGLEESIHSDEERAWSNYQDTEGTSLTDEMMETILSTPMRAEVEMLQREKVMWGEEREKMEQAIKDVRAERESVERWVELRCGLWFFMFEYSNYV